MFNNDGLVHARRAATHHVLPRCVAVVVGAGHLARRAGVVVVYVASTR
jgi:hypothetical protein